MASPVCLGKQFALISKSSQFLAELTSAALSHFTTETELESTPGHCSAEQTDKHFEAQSAEAGGGVGGGSECSNSQKRVHAAKAFS